MSFFSKLKRRNVFRAGIACTIKSWLILQVVAVAMLTTATAAFPSDEVRGARRPDVGVSCTSVTSEREKFIDFSHSFNETYTAIAVRQTTLWSAVTGFFSSPQVLKAVLIILGIAVLIGTIFYLLEHRTNKKLFSSNSLAPQNYAFILEQDRPLRENINRALLSERTQREWRDKIAEYIGE